MSLNNDVADVLNRLQRSRADAWGLEAGRMSSSLGDLEPDDAWSLSAALGVAARMIASEIAQTNQLLDAITNSIRNPLATAADELYRRGIHALSRTWTAEAIDDLRASVAANRYFAPAHAALGVGLVIHGQPDIAVDSFLYAVRYGTPDEPGIATGSAMMAASCLEFKGRQTQAVEVLNAAIHSFPQCPELLLMHARLSGNPQHVSRALRLAPDLAVPAMAAGVPGVELIAQAIVRDSSGPIAHARAMAGANLTLRSTSYLETNRQDFAASVLLSEGHSDATIMTAAGRLLKAAPKLSAEAEANVIRAEQMDRQLAEQTKVAAVEQERYSEALIRAYREKRGKSAELTFRWMCSLVVFMAVAGAIFWFMAHSLQTLRIRPGEEGWPVLVCVMLIGASMIIVIPVCHWLQEARTKHRRATDHLADQYNGKDRTVIQPSLASRSAERKFALRTLKVLAPLYSTRIHPWTSAP